MHSVELQLGDKIRAIGAPGVPHVGIVIELPIFGDPLVAHNQKARGVEIVPLAAFSEGRPVEVLSRIAGDWRLREEIVERARSLAGRRYDLLNFNCEHYASFVQTGIASSPQVRAVFVLAAVLFGIALLSEA